MPFNEEEMKALNDSFSKMPDPMQAGRARAVQGAEVSPDKAAKAVDLGALTGMPPSAIIDDVDDYEKQFRARNNADIAAQHPHVAQYLQRPMAAEVSNDDMNKILSIALNADKVGQESSFGKVIKSFKEGFDKQPYGEWLQDERAHDFFQQYPELYYAMGTLGLPVETVSKVFSGGLAALSTGLEESMVTAGADRDTASRWARDLTAMAEYQAMKGEGHKPGRGELNRGLKQGMERGLEKANQSAGFKELEDNFKMFQTARPYFEAGEHPPPRLDPKIDKVIADQSKNDLKQLDDLAKEAQASKTFERAPDFIKGLIEQYGFDERKVQVQVSGEAVRKLYGDKEPEIGDKLLGDIPGISEQLWNAEVSGGYVNVPIRDWATIIDPEVAKALKDDIRLRNEGLTKNEGEALREYHSESEPVEKPKEVKPPIEGENIQVDTSKDGVRTYRVLVDGQEIASARLRKEAGQASSVTNLQVDEQFRRKGVATRLYDRIETDLQGDNRELIPDHFISDEAKAFWENRVPGITAPYLPQPGGGNALGMGGVIQRALASQEGRRIRATVDTVRKASGLEPLFDIEGYHGSRHEFEAFTNEAIGSGQGAQTYGHGHYIAENPEVARTYGEHITQTHGNSGFTSGAGPFQNIPMLIPKKEPGNLYRVRVKAEKEHFLDWDKPLSEQPQAVKDLFETLSEKEEFTKAGNEVTGAELYDAFGNDALNRATKVRIEAEKVFAENDTQENWNKVLAAQKLEDELTIDRGKGSKERASKMLHEAGIPGIKYLDQGSRDKGEGTSNYVIFDPSTIEVLSRNDEPIPRFQLRRQLKAQEGGQFEPLSRHAEVQKLDKPTEDQQRVVDAVIDITKQMGGKSVDVEAFKAIRSTMGSRAVNGVFQQFAEKRALIALALNSSDIYGAARHEVIHHLRQGGFFTKEEWKTLEETADKEGWIEKHKVNQNYKDLSRETQLEESVAHEFAEWRRTTEKGDRAIPSGIIHEIFTKFMELLDQVKDAFHKVTGKDATFEDIFGRVERGEVGRREHKPLHPDAFREARQGELDVTRMEDKKLFQTAAAMGRTPEQARFYEKLLAERKQQDLERQQKAAQAMETKRQTKEWRVNEAAMRKEVEPEISARPDLQADEFLRNSTLYGQKIASRPKLKTDALSEEQRAKLPPEYMAKGGIDPDDFAGLFGYGSGVELVDRVASLNQARKQAGLQPKEYLDRLVAQETETRMQKKYGDLAENILREAEEHVISDTQFDLLHEQTLAIAEQAGMEMSFTKEQIKKAAENSYKDTLIQHVDSRARLMDSGKAYRNIETALLKGDPKTAFKEAQAQMWSLLKAKEAMKIEKKMEQFDRTANRFKSREVGSVEQEYTNFVRQVLTQVGKLNLSNVRDIQTEIAAGTEGNIADFVTAKRRDLRELYLADFLADPAWKKDFDSLSVREFEGVKDTIDTLVKNGRDEKKIYKAGDAADLGEKIKEMKGGLQEFELKDYSDLTKNRKGIANTLKHYVASSTTVETILNYIDKNDPRGVFNQYITRPLVEAANYKAVLEKQFAAKLRDVGEVDKPKKLVENRLFIDPQSVTEDNPQGTPFRTNRLNLMSILQNAGNRENLGKLLEGYKVSPERAPEFWDWLFRNTTKEDWDRAQAIGDIFSELKEHADKMYRKISGIAPKSVEITPIETPYGTYAGWYHPLIKDPSREAEKGKIKVFGDEALQREGYFPATTPNGYTKERTGAIYPVDLNYDQFPFRMNQMIHDIAFRESVIQTSKVFRDKGFMNEFKRRMGNQYGDALIPYLQDITNGSNFNSAAKAEGARVSEFMRQNAIATYIGLNLGTVLKHGPTAWVNSMKEVGSKDFLRAVSNLFSKDEVTGERNWDFAITTSEELQRRSRHWSETIRGVHKENLSKSTLRETVMELGSKPVALSDLISAVPTWLAQYEKSIADGVDHGQAVFEADRAVRRAHGSTAVTSLPAIARGGAAHSWLTSLYGFFGNQMQRRLELAWDVNKAYKLGKEGELKQAMKMTPDLTARTFAYVIAPSLIEEAVVAHTNDEKRGLISMALWGLANGVASSFIYARDLVHGFSSGHEPSVGLLSSVYHDAAGVVKDMAKAANDDTAKKPFSKENAGKTVQHAITLFGLGTGLTNQAEARAVRFGIDMLTGQSKPKDFSDYWRGTFHGDTKAQSPYEKYILQQSKPRR